MTESLRDKNYATLETPVLKLIDTKQLLIQEI